jgi:hypothetical protein
LVCTGDGIILAILTARVHGPGVGAGMALMCHASSWLSDVLFIGMPSCAGEQKHYAGDRTITGSTARVALASRSTRRPRLAICFIAREAVAEYFDGYSGKPMGGLRRHRAHHRSPAQYVRRGLPGDIRREQDAHLQDGFQIHLFLGTKENTGTAYVQSRPFAPCRFTASPIAQRCSNGEPLGTRPEISVLLPWIVLQA